MESGIVVRAFKDGDEATILQILKARFRELEFIARAKKGLSSGLLVREGAFVAEQEGIPVGCIGLVDYTGKGSYELRWLGSLPGQPASVLEGLVDKALEFAEPKKTGRLKAFTPSVQPNVDVYKGKGFVPERRQLRFGWDMKSDYEIPKDGVQVERIGADKALETRDVWVKALSPYWDWWIEEQGGPDEAGSWIEESLKGGDYWLGAFMGGKLVGTTMVSPDFYEPGEARFNGVYALPELRGRGVGMSLMQASIKTAKELGQKHMSVNTVAFLDHLPPGAILYMKSGGRIEGEYLEMYR